MTSGATYEALTHNIRVRAEPAYAVDHSSPQDDRFMWHYTIRITNEGEQAVQLLSRVWSITDALGRTQEVRGEGVVGLKPLIAPGKSFTYTSGCPLETSSGIMVGSYQMAGEDGEHFNVEIPAFSLDTPDTVRVVN